MPKKKKKSQRIILTQHPIDLSDADVVPPKLRRKREALPIIKKKIKMHHLPPESIDFMFQFTYFPFRLTVSVLHSVLHYTMTYVLFCPVIP